MGSNGSEIFTDLLGSTEIGNEMDGAMRSAGLGSSGWVDSTFMNSSRGKRAESLE